MMRRAWLVLITCGLAVGCTGRGDKGRNADQDKPRATNKDK